MSRLSRWLLTKPLRFLRAQPPVRSSKVLLNAESLEERALLSGGLASLPSQSFLLGYMVSPTSPSQLVLVAPDGFSGSQALGSSAVTISAGDLFGDGNSESVTATPVAGGVQVAVQADQTGVVLESFEMPTLATNGSAQNAVYDLSNGNLLATTEASGSDTASGGTLAASSSATPASPSQSVQGNTQLQAGQALPQNQPVIPPYPDIPLTAPTVTEVLLNDGESQRSIDNQLTVIFSEPVTLATGAFTLSNSSGASITDTGTAGSPILVFNPSGDATTWVLSFPNASSLVDNEALYDGQYQLTVNATKVTAGIPGSGLMGQGTPMVANYYTTSDFSSRASVTALFGDSNGDGVVNETDLTAFDGADGSRVKQSLYAPYFDEENANKTITAQDLSSLMSNYTAAIAPAITATALPIGTVTYNGTNSFVFSLLPAQTSATTLTFAKSIGGESLGTGTIVFPAGATTESLASGDKTVQILPESGYEINYPSIATAGSISVSLTVPGAQTAAATGNLEFSSANGNGIAITNVLKTDTYTVNLSVAYGTLSLATHGGLTFTQGSATLSAAMTFTGTGTNVNDALNSLVYYPEFGTTAVPPDLLTIGVRDTSSAPGNGASDQTVQITHTWQMISVPGTQATTAGVPLSFGPNNAITVTDPNTSLKTILSDNTGDLGLGSMAGVSVLGNNTPTVTVTGSPSAITTALGTLTFTSSTAGSDQLTIQAIDQAIPAQMRTVTASFAINVAPPAPPPPPPPPPPASPPAPPDFASNQDSGGSSLVSDPSGASRNAPDQDAATGVRYADGAVSLTVTDLSSSGIGPGWGLTRTWTSGTGYAVGAVNGNRWVDDEAPHLIEVSGLSTLAVIGDGQQAWYFSLQNGVYVAQFAGGEGLRYDSSTNTYTMTDGAGDQLKFDGFGGSFPATMMGTFQSETDPDGVSIVAGSFDSYGNPGTLTATEGSLQYQYTYAYSPGGTGPEQLSMVSQTMSTNGGSTWEAIQHVSYTYYGTGSSNGNLGDLEYAQVFDAGGTTPISTDYYRYYIGGGLKLALSGPSYARVEGANLGADSSLTDAQIAPYADDLYEYNAQGQASSVMMAGSGMSTDGGSGIGGYSYTYAPAGQGVTAWAEQTTETLPDGNQNVVFTNANGDVVLSSFQEPSTGQQWDTYYQYNSSGSVTLEAAPSAVSGYSTTAPGTVTLNANSGLITEYTYGTTTTATTTTPGNVAGYLDQTYLLNGTAGTPDIQDTEQYIANTATVGGLATTTYPVASATAYQGDDGSGAETTSYVTTFYPGTQQVYSIQTTLPVVPTADNGSGSANASTVWMDPDGRTIWTEDAAGHLTYTAYNDLTGAVTEQIDDVNTNDTSEFTGLPSGLSNTSGLNRVTTYQSDSQGRTTEMTSADGDATFTVYNDVQHETLTYMGWTDNGNGTFSEDSLTTLPPTQVSIDQWGTGQSLSFTMSATPHLTGGVPDGTEAVGGLESLTVTDTNLAGQTIESDAYFSLSSVVIEPQDPMASNFGTAAANYYPTLMGYDAFGREDRNETPAGTITRTVYDGMGRVSSVWVGTDDTTTSGAPWTPGASGTNLVETEADVYDNGGVGDSDLTAKTMFSGSSQAPDEITLDAYDWRDRQVAEKDGASSTDPTNVTGDTAGVNRPVTISTFDNLGEVTETQRFDGDGVPLTASGPGVGSGLLRSQETMAYDPDGQEYQSTVYGVSPSTGTLVPGALLTSNSWYNSRGELAASAPAGGVVTKDVYDGLGQLTTEYQTDGEGDTSYSGAMQVTGDVVLSQVEYAYDAAGLRTETISSERATSDSATSLGALQSTPGGSGLGAWITYEGMWYDDAGRLVTTADVGTNGGVGWSMPATAPTVSSATDEVTVDGYNQQGEQSTVTDPDGYITNTTFDGLGRKLTTVEDATGSATPGNGSAAQNKTTTYTYGPAGETSLTAFDNGVGQTTQYVYGVSTATGSTINSNDIVGVTEYPDPTTGQPSTASNEEATVTVDAQGQTLTSTDRNGTTHTYTYDPLGRQTLDSVTTLGSGVDGTVRSIGTAYDSQGNPYLVTSYSSANGTGIVNQDEKLYDGFGDVAAEYQSVNGAVTIGSTPVVQYTYSDGANNSDAMTGTVYPDGYTVTDNYAGTTDTAISRLSSLSDSSGNVESYTYQGVSTVLGRSQAVQSLSTTLDNFGNVAEQKWTSGTTVNSDYQYTYDSDNNVLSRADQVNSALSQTYTYDGLNQLTAYTEGGTPAQSYGYDSLGNRTSVTTGTGSPVTWAANEQNEITNAGAGTTTPVYDADGNMTTDQNGNTYTWDAWNRLISVTSGATVETFTYDADSRLVTDTVGGVATNRFYSKQDQVLEEQSGGNWTARYIWSPVYVNALIFRDTPASGTRVWAEQDANYNVVVLVNASGAVVERFDYSAFGVQAATGSITNWAYGWQGMRLDAVSGWVESESRWYSPTLGSWTSVDPLGFGGGDVREYGFEGNGPVEGLDSSGLAQSKIPLFQICNGFAYQLIKNKDEVFKEIDESAKTVVDLLEKLKNLAGPRDVIGKVLDAGQKAETISKELAKIFGQGFKAVGGNIKAAELAVVAAIGIVTDENLVLSVNQDRADHNLVSKDPPIARLTSGGFGDIELPNIGKLLGVKLTANPPTVCYSKDDRISWCRVSINVTFTLGAFKDHPLLINPEGEMYGVTAKDDVIPPNLLYSGKGQIPQYVRYDNPFGTLVTVNKLKPPSYPDINGWVAE